MIHAWILRVEQNVYLCEWKTRVKIINPLKQKPSENGGGWADGVTKRVSLHVYFAAYCDLFTGSSISFSHACHYRQRTSVDSLYGSRNFSPSSSNPLFLALPILNPRQAADIQEIELVVHTVNRYPYFIRALHAFRFNNRLWVYMKDSKGNGHLWRQVMTIVLLPLTIFIWMTGWTLYWLGAQRMSPRTAQKKTTQIPKEGTFERETLKEASPQQIVA